VPHMGWNRVIPSDRPGAADLLAHTGGAPYAYFVHSYYAVPDDPEIVLAHCDYGISFPAIVGRDNVYATQFHPEKSQHEGLGILKAFGNKVAGMAGVA